MRTKNDDVATAAAIYARQSFELAGTPNSVSSEPGAGHKAYCFVLFSSIDCLIRTHTQRIKPFAGSKSPFIQHL